MTRRGFTIVEAVCALAIAGVVIAGAWSVLRMCARGQAAPEHAATAAALRALAHAIAEDVMQCVTEHAEPVEVSDDRLAFSRAVFRGADVAAVPVRYRFAGGRLTREDGGAARPPLPAVELESCRFARVGSPRAGNVYVLLHMVARRAAGVRTPPEISLLLPVPQPPARNNPAFVD